MAFGFERLGAAAAEELAGVAAQVQSSVVLVRASPGGFGSGVIWNDRGLIVTNDHVIDGGPRRRGVISAGSSVAVELPSGERLVARIAQRSRTLDLAVLQLDEWPTEPLVPARLGSAASHRVGELVLAVGNPLGERQAVALGALSGWSLVDRAGQPRPLLQVNITLRPGNSGGALADVAGRVIGIPFVVVGPGQALAIPTAVIDEFLHRDPATIVVDG